MHTTAYTHDISYPWRWTGTGKAEFRFCLPMRSQATPFPWVSGPCLTSSGWGKWERGGPGLRTDALGRIADPGPSPSAVPPPPASWNEPAGQHYFSSLATAACPPASPSEAGGASSSSTSSSSAASLPTAPRPVAESLLSARSRSNSAERLLEAASVSDETPEAAPGEGSRSRTRAVENQYSFY